MWQSSWRILVHTVKQYVFRIARNGLQPSFHLHTITVPKEIQVIKLVYEHWKWAVMCPPPFPQILMLFSKIIIIIIIILSRLKIFKIFRQLSDQSSDLVWCWKNSEVHSYLNPQIITIYTIYIYINTILYNVYGLSWILHHIGTWWEVIFN